MMLFKHLTLADTVLHSAHAYFRPYSIQPPSHQSFHWRSLAHSSSSQVLEAGREDGGFRLRDRALHVFEEAQRVRDFKVICDGPNQAGDDASTKLKV